VRLEVHEFWYVCRGCGRVDGDPMLVDMLTLGVLAHNLAIAGGLCESFDRGSTYRMRAMIGLPADEDWKPGCAIDDGKKRRKAMTKAEEELQRATWKLEEAIAK
jgi:hypothetical protein